MPIPTVTLSNPQDPFIGQSFDLNLGFDNTGTATGFGPFAVLFLDTTGVDGTGNETDDGLIFANATYLGSPVTTTTITLEDTNPQTITAFGNSTTVNVPSNFEVGDTLVVIELPFGSFVATQPVADVKITVDSSNLADLNQDLHLEAQGGFIFGDTETGNTPIIQSGTSATAIQPQLVTIQKNYLGPEDETATGPNFPQRYEIVVSVAPGQTVTELDITDYLPDTMQFVDVVSIEVNDTLLPSNSTRIIEVETPDDGGLTSNDTSTYQDTNDIGNDGIPTPGSDIDDSNLSQENLIRRIDTVTGTGGRDIVMTVEFFVPRLDANGDVIINAITGDDIFDQNQSELGGKGGANQWIPIDTPRDDNVTVSIDRTINDDPADPTDPDDTNLGVEGQTDTGLTGYGSDSDSGDEFNDPDHVLEEQSIAIQKGVANQSNPGEAFTPGTVLEYTLEFQVSDYFAFEDVFVTDTFSDGQRFDSTFTPTLFFREHGNADSGMQFSFSGYTPVGNSGTGSISSDTAADFLLIDETDIGNNIGAGNDVNDGTTGTTQLTFKVSDLLNSTNATTGQDNQLLGGGVPDGGFTAYNTANNPDLGLQNNPPLGTGFNGTIGTIVFRTVVQEQYSDNYPSGDTSVDSEDVLNNDAIIDGRVLNVDDLQPYSTGDSSNPFQREDDDTQAQLSIASGSLYKSIFALNGVVDTDAANDTNAGNGVDGYDSGIDVSPGDTVTYRLTFDLPVSDIENFILEDFLPIPIYEANELINATAADLNNSTPDNSVPAVGAIEFGSLHTFPKLVQTTEDLSSEVDDGATNDGLYIDTTQNSFLLDFGDFDDTNASPSVVDILFTVTTQNDPYVDGLLFTNQVQQKQQNTFNEELAKEAIIQINLRQPDLDITKGIVAVESDNTTNFDPATIAPSTANFAATPGAVDAFSGSVVSVDGDTTTDNLSTNAIDSNLTGGLAAGDLVTFALTVENKERLIIFRYKIVCLKVCYSLMMVRLKQLSSLTMHL